MDREGRRIDEEIRHHMEELEAHLRAEGRSPEEARAEARRRFGDPEAVNRRTRAVGRPDSRGLRGGWTGDAIQALRGLRRAPGFAVVVVLTLTLALGATVAVFSVVHGVLLRPLGVDAPDRLAALLEVHPPTGIRSSPTSAGTLRDWRTGLRETARVEAWEPVLRTLEDPDAPAELVGAEVTPGFFGLLGVEPVLGRGFVEADAPPDAPAQAVLLTWDFWQERFGANPGVVGRRLPLDGTDREVVGVLPPSVPLPGAEARVVLPSAFAPRDATNRGTRTLHAVARLLPGATLEELDARVATLSREIAETYPASARGWSARALPLRDHLLGPVERPLQVAFAAVLLLLGVAGVNVANLLLVRAADGRREMAVRAALGAGRARLVRIRLAESLVLGIAGGAGGLVTGLLLQRALSALEPGILPRSVTASPEPVVVAFGLAAAVLVGLAVGVLPAVRSAESAVEDLARGTGGAGPATDRGWARRGLVVLQLAVTVVLLVGAGLLVRTVAELGSVDPGFEPEGVVAARISLDDRRYPDDARAGAYWDEVVRRVRALPGVEAAGVASTLPMDRVSASFDLPTRSEAMAGVGWGEAPQADLRIVGDGYMEALGFRLGAGRFLDAGDRADAPGVAVVNRSLAELFWPGEPAVGRRLQTVWQHDGLLEVVGVVEDTRFYGPARDPRPEVFLPAGQVPWDFMTVVARVAEQGPSPAAALEAVERTVVEVDPRTPPQAVFPVTSLVAATTAAERFYAILLGGFAVLATALASAGVYGVLAYGVRLRSRELGVRLALGASRGEILARVLRSGLGLAGTGIVLGLAATIPAGGAVSGMLFGVEARDPLTLGSVAGVLVAMAALACLLPAWRASRLDPVRVLREGSS
jgi:putative ABC transport system permease protein